MKTMLAICILVVFYTSASAQFIPLYEHRQDTLTLTTTWKKVGYEGVFLKTIEVLLDSVGDAQVVYCSETKDTTSFNKIIRIPRKTKDGKTTLNGIVFHTDADTLRFSISSGVGVIQVVRRTYLGSRR